MSLRSSRSSSSRARARALRLLLGAALALLVLVLAPRTASAQSIAIQLKQTLVRRAADGSQVTKDPNLQPYGINLDDCRSNQSVEFSLVLAAYQAGDVVEVWATDAGGDCSQPTARTGGTQVCYQLDAVVPLTPNPIVRIPVKKLIAGREGQGSFDSQGCRLRSSKTSIDVQFLLFRGGNTGIATTKDNAPLNVKTLGPSPLTGIKALPGDTRITISWNQIGEGGVDDVLGVRAYCDVNPTAAGATAPTTTTVCEDGGQDEAGNPQDGGCREETTRGSGGGTIPSVDGVGDNGTACDNSAFARVDGGTVVPDSTFAKYQCGSLSGVTGNTIVATSAGGAPLPNGKVIAVAVAGTDSFGNVGELSDAICQFPESTTDFWKGYKDAGGSAGGCDIAATTGTAASTCALGVALACAASMARRARSRASGKRSDERSERTDR